MAYQIQYCAQTKRKYPRFSSLNRKHSKRITGISIALIVLISLLFRPVRAWLFPGDLNVAESAANKMVETLQSGSDMKDAISVFCREVITHGLRDQD